MAKEYVPIFFDWIDITKELTSEEKGILIDSLVEYGKGEIDELSANDQTVVAFLRMRSRIDKYDSLQEKRSGEFHWNWKGGITPQNQKERSSGRYAQWRKAVFLRDNFTCQMCGQVGGGLNAHHIKRWSTNVDERYQIDNGITLCKKCHHSLHRKEER